MLAVPLFAAVAPAPGVLVAVSPLALGLAPVVLALPAFALCDEAALPLISGLLLAVALPLGLVPTEVLELGVEEALCEEPLIEPAAAPVPAAAAAPGLLPEALLQLGEMELTLETWIMPLPLSVPEIDTVWPTFWLSCEVELLSPCRVHALPLLSVRL